MSFYTIVRVFVGKKNKQTALYVELFTTRVNCSAISRNVAVGFIWEYFDFNTQKINDSSAKQTRRVLALQTHA